MGCGRFQGTRHHQKSPESQVLIGHWISWTRRTHLENASDALYNWISQIQAKIIPQRGWRTCARWTLVTRAVKPRLTNKLPSLPPFIRPLLMQNLASFVEHFITFSTTPRFVTVMKSTSVEGPPLWRYDNFTTMAAAITFSPAAITAITRDNCHQRGGPCLSQS